MINLWKFHGGVDENGTVDKKYNSTVLMRSRMKKVNNMLLSN